MAYWLARSEDRQQLAPLTRFDPLYWTVDFPRPMMAAVTTTASDALRVDAVFYRSDDLAGLIWTSEDRLDHPLLAYETERDYRGCQLSFRWQSQGLMPLDAVNGPTLTIEGRDAQGQPRSWYVRLWNYAAGTPEDAEISLDFDRLDGGFLLPGEADPVHAADIDRLFISLVPPGYGGAAADLPTPAAASLLISALRCTGPGATLMIGDVIVPPHGLSIATGYDDSYNQTPARLLRSIVQLGYRGTINHYVGMSHYFRLSSNGGGGLLASLDGGAINGPCRAWHEDFAARIAALDYQLIISLSYELFDAHCPAAWKQRTADGGAAATGYVPPSTLLSPAQPHAMAYLQSVARAFVAIAVSAGLAPRFQIGEPWWWIMPDRRPCLYDAAARAALGGDPPVIASIDGAHPPAVLAMLDAAGAILANSTTALAAAVRQDHPDCETLLLPYLPTILDARAPALLRANLPTGWAAPAFDIIQLEDYDFVTTGNRGASARAAALIEARLGYPVARQHYFAGFVLRSIDRDQWQLIEAAAQAARARGVAATFIWAQPQVARDGYVHFETGEKEMQAFDDVQFPLALGRGALVIPQFSTAIVTTANGHEQRNSDWANARLRFDAGPGVRSEADLQTLIAFFRARRGAARAFRFRDPFDCSSNGMTGVVTAGDQWLGDGDGIRTEFALVKRYGRDSDGEVRPIRYPVAGSLLVSVNGMLTTSGWELRDGGIIAFSVAPASGARIRAGFQFDVPVRFAEDQLEIEADGIAAGAAPRVPLIEVRD